MVCFNIRKFKKSLFCCEQVHVSFIAIICRQHKLFHFRLLNKQDLDNVMEEMDICRAIDLEQIVNQNRCPTRIVHSLKIYQTLIIIISY